MSNTIDMQIMRYINLFESVSGVSTTNCFVYNNIVFFAVPKAMIFRAIGKNGENVKKIGEVFRKKIKVIEVREMKDARKFVEDVVEPVSFTNFEIRNNNAILNAGKQSKAALIGRNRTREQELEDILKRFFGIEELVIL